MRGARCFNGGRGAALSCGLRNGTSCNLKVVSQPSLHIKQLAGNSFLNDPAILHDDNFVRFFRERHAMRDEDHRAAGERAGKRIGNAAFGNGVERGGWLVHDENGRIAEKSAGESNALSLAGGHGAAPLADDGVVSFGQRGDQRINGGVPSAGANFVQGGAWFSIGDVFADGGAEKIGGLLDQGDVTAKIAEAQSSDIVAVDGYGARIGIVEAKD